MKKIAILLSLAAAAMFAATGCNSHSGKSEAGEAQQSESVAIAQGSIVYFNLDQVLDEYDMANDLRSEVEAKVATIQKEVERRQKNLENAVNDFTNKVNKGLMTSAVAAEQQRLMRTLEGGINILNGRYGPYIAYDGKNYRLPKNLHERAAELTYEECMDIVNNPVASKRTAKK